MIRIFIHLLLHPNGTYDTVNGFFRHPSILILYLTSAFQDHFVVMLGGDTAPCVPRFIRVPYHATERGLSILTICLS